MIAFLRRLWNYVRPYRARLVMGLICGVFFAITNVALVGVIKLVINVIFPLDTAKAVEQEAAKAGPFHDIVKHASEYVTQHLHIPPPSTRAGMAVLVSLIPIVMFLRSLFGYLNAYLMTWASSRTIADLRTKLFNHLQSLPLSFFSQSNTGDLISRIMSDTQTIQWILNNAISTSIRDPLTIVALLAYNFFQYPKLTALSLVVLPVCIVPISIYSRKVRKSARALQTHAAELSKLMLESFTGNRVVKAYNLEGTMGAQFRAITQKYVSHIMRVVRANEIPGSAMEVFGAIGIAAVIYYVSSDKTVKPGDLLAFIGSIYVMYAPIKNVTRLYNQIHQAEAASARVFELLEIKNDIIDPPNPLPLKAAGAEVRFENVEFSYGEKGVLHGINLTVKPGQLVALVGKSGSGKTTLVNMLPRFYDPQKGAVRIGDTNIKDVSVADLRRQIAIVTQETILFHDSIRSNIAAGSTGVSDAGIETAARAANAHEFIAEKAEGYNTIVGEKGMMLSGGQRQRISIARAIVKDAPILILDEATNALDAESERAVQEQLEKLMIGRTTLCIAHRLSTIQKADVIVVMNEGEIVETGTHAELIQRGGVYHRLYELSTTV